MTGQIPVQYFYWKHIFGGMKGEDHSKMIPSDGKSTKDSSK